MTYFTSDGDLLMKICTDLKQVGCCSRCTLRFIGLKDMFFYRSDTQGMDSIVEDLCKQKVKTTDDVEMDEGNEKEISESLVAQNGNGQANGKKCPEAKVETDSNNECPEAKVETDSNNECPEAKVETDSNNECPEAKVETDSNNECPELKVETDSNNECQELKVKTDSNNECPEIKVKTDSNNECTELKVKTNSNCVVCLGILEKFTSLEFLNEVKNATEEFDFTTYMCSLMIPVCVILREHALMLYLKEKFELLYSGKKYTDVTTIKDVWKWRNGPVLKDMLNAAFDVKSQFDVTLTYQYKSSDQECSFLLSSDTDTFRKRKKDRRFTKKSSFTIYNRVNVAKAVEDMPEEEFKSQYQIPPRQPTCETLCDIKCQNENVFVAGRYNKYSRFLSQTPWFIEGVRKSESSVEEHLCTEINKYFKPTEQKFSSSGREDVDVLMLGNGRPFVLELLNPRCRHFTQEQMTEIQQKVNAATTDIKCTDLQIVSREDTERLKEGEIDKVKQYRALCWTKEKVSKEKLLTLTQNKDLKLLQKTPIRVLHRRPLSTRDKIIHSLTVDQIDDHHFKVDMSTQAGTYIKEFVHGDFGRTKPNMTSLLGVDCDILELDVLAVELDWPKKVDLP